MARFLGFDGTLEYDREMLLTRAPHVAIDPAGPLDARITRAIPLEDGVRLELELDHGRLYCESPIPAPRPGETVHVRIDGGVRFPLTQSESTVASS